MQLSALQRLLSASQRSCLWGYTGRATLATQAGGQLYSEQQRAHEGEDWIHIRGMRFHGRHGVLPEETSLGQPFVADASLLVDVRQAGDSDRLEHTVNYAEVYSDIRSVVEGPPLQLLEAVAHRGADLVLRRHPRVRAVRLGVRKLCIPGLHSVVDSVGVEVMRRRHPG